MKRILSLILTFVLLLSFTACNGNFAQVDLKEPIALSDDGVVEKNVFEKLKMKMPSPPLRVNRAKWNMNGQFSAAILKIQGM